MLLRATRFGDLRRRDIELVPKHKDFGFQRNARLEQPDQGTCKDRSLGASIG